MKTKKFMLLVALAFVTFASCGDDDDKTSDNPTQTENYDFVGQVIVSTGYMQDSVKSKFYQSTDQQTYSIYMQNVSFSASMPVKVNCELKDLPIQVNGEDTLITLDSVVPYWNDSPLNNMTLYNFTAKVTKDSLTFTSVGGLSTQDGENTLSYKSHRIVK